MSIWGELLIIDWRLCLSWFMVWTFISQKKVFLALDKALCTNMMTIVLQSGICSFDIIVLFRSRRVMLVVLFMIHRPSLSSRSVWGFYILCVLFFCEGVDIIIQHFSQNQQNYKCEALHFRQEKDRRISKTWCGPSIIQPDISCWDEPSRPRCVNQDESDEILPEILLGQKLGI